MRPFVTVILVLGIVGACSCLCADEGMGPQTSYFRFIDDRIERCLQKSLLIRSTSAQIRLSAERALQEAVFYQGKREELAKEMASRNVACTRHAVDHFLIIYFEPFESFLQAVK